MSTKVATIPCTEDGCAMAFGSTEARAIHVRTIHELRDPLSWPCRVDTCTSTFGTQANRDEHMRSDHGPLAAKAVPLLEHLAPGVTVDPIAGTITGPALEAGDESAPTEGAIVNEEPEQLAGYPCTEPDCGRVCTSAAGLASHRRSHAGVGGPPRPAPATPRELRPNLAVRIDPDLRELIDTVAFIRRMTVAEVVDAILADWAEGLEPELVAVAKLRTPAEESSP